MKKYLIFFASVLALSLAASEPLPALDWNTRDGKLADWSGKVEPLENGGMQLKGKNCFSYSQAKFPVRDQRNVRISFAVQGYASRIGIYCYSSNRLIGNFMERIPNADDRKNFEAVFAIPQQIKGKPVD
ncbi:MAG: hypothetical protein IJH79_13930, partial [Lentisphaeria bacterium]|nr:hypothetical protein [Lentisphaeria bacterium]